jgi:hypothetical protein
MHLPGDRLAREGLALGHVRDPGVGRTLVARDVRVRDDVERQAAQRRLAEAREP